MAAVSVQEAVRLAKDAMGEAPAPDMAAWIATNLGMTVKPVIVTVMLGSFMERENLDRTKQKAMELAGQMQAEEAEKPKGKKAKSCPPAAPAVQFRVAEGEKGCPACGRGNFVFRGRKFIQADPAKGIEAATETKQACRNCGNQRTVRKPA